LPTLMPARQRDCSLPLSALTGNFIRWRFAKRLSPGAYVRTLLSVYPAAIRHHMSAAITYLLHAFHGYRAGNRPEHTLKIHAHHAFILGIHRGSIHLEHLSICTRNNASRMLLSDWRFVFEIDVIGRNKDKRQDQRDHYVVMEASPRVCPEQITLQRAPNARHEDSLVEVLGRINQLPELPKVPKDDHVRFRDSPNQCLSCLSAVRLVQSAIIRVIRGKVF